MVVLARAGAAARVTATFTLLLLVAAAARGLVHKTIESEDGDVIDCVAIPHETHTRPERSMKDIIIAGSDIGTMPAQKRQQTWRKGGACPDGTAAVRRHTGSATAMELTRGISFSAAADGRDWSGGKLEMAAAYATWRPYHGLRANLPYNKVDVHPDEFSMTYVMVAYTLDEHYVGNRGGDPPKTLPNQIMAGLVTWPALYNDSLSRLFVYYTNDSGVVHKCFNLECGGFVVTSTEYGLGASWRDSDSQIGGQTYAPSDFASGGGNIRELHFFRDALQVPSLDVQDDTKMIWWVSVEDVDIGYYPDTKFDTRFPEGSYVEIGGRVLDTRPGGRHTTTPMGNMMPTCAGTRFAATIMEYLGINANGQLFKDPLSVSKTLTTTPACYDVKPVGFGKNKPGYVVAYGGPGGIYCDIPQQ